jgi:3',5'-cyclic AMP phosphodiesterase CpdA
MRTHVVVQVSDSHLAPVATEFLANWDAVIGSIADLKPDIIVHSGDIAWNDPGNEIEQSFARSQMERLTAPWLAIPGNHDIGDGPPAPVFGQMVTAERCARFRRLYGPDWWARDIGDWTLIGLNTLIFGTALPHEQEQWDWLADTLRDRSGRPIVLFMHKPAFVDTFDEDTGSSAAIPAVARRRLALHIAGSTVRLVASGHCHEYREYVGSPSFMWAPSTAFILRQDIPSRMRGRKVLGFIEHRFSGEQHSHRLIEPAGMGFYDNAFSLALRERIHQVPA